MYIYFLFFTKLSVGKVKLTKAIEIDEINAFLVILNSCLTREEYQSIISKILDYKYLIGFVYKEIEKSFLENRFTISDNIYFIKDFVAGIYMMPNDLVQSIQNSVLKNLLFEWASINISNDESTLDIAKSEVVIRTCLILSNSDLYKDLFDEVEKMVRLSRIFADYENMFFPKLLTYHNEDKKRLNNISFGLK